MVDMLQEIINPKPYRQLHEQVGGLNLSLHYKKIAFHCNIERRIIIYAFLAS